VANTPGWRYRAQGSPVIVEILYFEGCPSHGQLLPRVQRLAERAGADVRQRRIETPEEAEHQRFLGSPTIRVNGRDIDPGANDRTDHGVKCRLYHLQALGRSPTPPDRWIQAALEAARG
jgi:hypothetical protein